MKTANVQTRIDHAASSHVADPGLVLWAPQPLAREAQALSGRSPILRAPLFQTPKITITDVDTGFIRTTTTNSTGNYSAPELPIGHYQLRMEVTGLQNLRAEGHHPERQ